VQAKLLRVLETGRFRRLGGNEETAVDVRIVAATNRNLKEAISRGHFREDLYYRLSTFTIEIPPLRDRRDDIRTLADHFITQFNLRFSVSKRLSDAAMQALMRHDWPGNVRELIHVVEQAIALSDGDVVGVDDLSVSISPKDSRPRHTVPPASGDPIPTLREIERAHIFSVLDRVDGNRAQAARLLGMSERSFYRVLRRYRLVPAQSDRA
jgi:DNA-binding NtrC family response regulator